MKIKNNKKGFTLVELVIVIAVIAILAAVLIPTFATVITKANKSAAQQEASNLYEGILVEYAEKGSIEDYCGWYLKEHTTQTEGGETTVTQPEANTVVYNDKNVTFGKFVSEGTKVTIEATKITVEAKGYTFEITSNGVKEA